MPLEVGAQVKERLGEHVAFDEHEGDASARQEYFPRPRSRECCGPRPSSAAFRHRVEIRVLCACDFLSHMRMLTRGCFLTQGAVLASAVAVGAAVSLSISRSRVLTPIF